uniref:CSON010971 protein n=1 Tax=Culicoides sonorensis TaxID=179676 RepID=A0A336LLH6_CULSO
MKFIIILLMCGLVIDIQGLIITKRSVTEEGCEPGTTFNIDCNTCKCSDERVAACTRKACPPQLSDNKLNNKRSIDENKDKCEPGTTWQDECNTCFCSADGEPVCTLALCLKRDDKNTAKRSTDDHKCAPGETWAKDCYTCICTDNGEPFCTAAPCI